ncbi:MAG: hypothetical protein MJZ81_10540 [Bacteroidales bacterium]|nr:hypothetical protein [Bacteroidales bacterium]
MNRLQFFLKAKTKFNLHSPFVFDLYREVLFAPLAKERRRELAIADKRQELIYKLANHLQPQHLFLAHMDDHMVELVRKASPHTVVEEWTGQTPSPSDIVLLSHPHRSEQLWQRLQAIPHATATLDLFHTGILLFNQKLHKQYFLLRK